MPIFDQPLILAVAALYLVAVLGIGAWAARRTRSSRDFFIAGQRIGLWVTAFATMSAAFSGFVFLGGPGLTYRIGISSLLITVSVSFTAAMLCWTLAKRLRLLAEVREIFTIPDVIEARFGSRKAAGLAAVAILVASVGYLGAQLQAAGIIVESLLGTDQWFGEWSLLVAMAIGLAVVLAYAVAGGMVAGVYTDLLQGILMLTAALGVFYYALRSGGGLESMARRIVASEEFGPRFLDPLGNVPALTALGFFFLFSIGTLGQPHMLHKFLMLDDPRKLKWMPLVIGGSQSLCILVWLGIGLAVPALVASGEMAPLENPDHAAPLFLLRFTPGLLAGAVFAAILAAIMSTADSFLNIGSAAIVRDLPRSLGRRVRNELRWSRVGVAVIGLVSAVFAWLYDDLIALLGTFAFGTFAAALAPTLVIGLNWKGVTARAATASIATGFFANLGLETVRRLGGLESLGFAPGILPGAVALLASFSVLLVVSWLDRPSALDEDVEAVMEM